MTVHVAHPFRIDGRGRVAEVDDALYVEQLVEQVLFTSPGERVNRPTFGSGLPLSVQFVGRYFEEATVLRAAAAWERAAGGPKHPPLM